VEKKTIDQTAVESVSIPTPALSPVTCFPETTEHFHIEENDDKPTNKH
jgi:hypothetical protein